MKNAIPLFSLFLFLSFFAARGQYITGTVSDGSCPLPGATVTVKGTTKGTQTDFDGNYKIVAMKGDILVFSYIGYITQHLRVSDSNIINVLMEEDAQVLDEVVVVGYGVQREMAMTAAVVQVSPGYAMQSKVKQDLRRALSGKVAGLEVQSESLHKEPIYIVDGKPIARANNPIIEKIHPHEIKKKHIYSPGKAQSVYGITAKKGCIVITAKNGNYEVENDESYARINENKFQHVSISPLSTFSIDVDKAAYSNIRRMINNGKEIPPGAVKIEEMVNYFEYDYGQPTAVHPFSIHSEMATTPWNPETRLVRIGLQGKTYAHAELPPSNLTFLIDVSGSMNAPKKLPLLKSAFSLLVNQLRERDKVSIVVYAGAAGVVLPPTNGSDKKKILEALENLDAGGSTAGGEGLELAYALAQKNFRKKGNNRVILATDGDFNVGPSSDTAMEALIVEKRKSGVFLSVLGFGMGNYKDSKLEVLADKGNGNHAYIDTMQEVQKIFGKEFGGTLFTIAKDVKIQVEFNPALVQGYRLIGYENRMLATEDFRDDTKDAGELGSGHTVTALYEVIPHGKDSSYLKDIPDLKYAREHSKSDTPEEWLTVRLRYKRPKKDLSTEIVHPLIDVNSKMSPDFTFASAVALFGMQLRESSYHNNSSLEDVLALAERGRGTDRNGYRAEFIRLVKTMENNF
ncbi:MAG: von Willebrand factor type A domain-containing protein [Bacteroidota bacterium]